MAKKYKYQYYMLGENGEKIIYDQFSERLLTTKEILEFIGMYSYLISIEEAEE